MTPTETTVVHVRDVDLSDPDVVYIGRRNNRYRLKESIWANHFVIAGGVTRELSLEFYERAIRVVVRGSREHWNIETLRGKRLACWCSPLACHGDILVKLLRDAP